MANSLKVSGFIVLVVVLIAGFASLIPQLESPAPEELVISGELSGAELAALGEGVFNSAAAGCLACHGLGNPGLRAPDLAGIGAAAGERVAGLSPEQYLRQSLNEPCSFVVSGYDCIMPQALRQTLGDAKLTALVAFLQSQGGEVTVRLSAAAAQASDGEAGAGIVGVSTAEIFTNAGCVACHTLAAVGAAGQVGPDLSELGGRLTPDEIRRSILFPDEQLAQNCPTGPCLAGLMPKAFGESLSALQLETLVAFLSEQGAP
ncbi:MAG: c-type cytochrome [Anaerolineales bacterium]